MSYPSCVRFLTTSTICQNTDMGQGESRIDLETSVGYLVKEVSSALRSAMDAGLRPLGMSTTRYACLELLAQRPGLSNSDLARGAFVTRQSMNVLLQSLERDGLVVRPKSASGGRAIPAELTNAGQRQLAAASSAVRRVEDRMSSGLSAAERSQLKDMLSRCSTSLKDRVGSGG